MIPWTALLESLHSALIDELTERHPDPKPELGMPVRKPRFELPDADLAPPICASVSFGKPPSGCVVLCLCPEAARRLGLDTAAFWEALVGRAQGEFGRRSIQPRFGRAMPLSGAGSLPAGFGEPQRMVWIPFKVGSGKVFLGMGV